MIAGQRTEVNNRCNEDPVRRPEEPSTRSAPTIPCQAAAADSTDRQTARQTISRLRRIASVGALVRRPASEAAGNGCRRVSKPRRHEVSRATFCGGAWRSSIHCADAELPGLTPRRRRAVVVLLRGGRRVGDQLRRRFAGAVVVGGVGRVRVTPVVVVVLAAAGPDLRHRDG